MTAPDSSLTSPTARLHALAETLATLPDADTALAKLSAYERTELQRAITTIELLLPSSSPTGTIRTLRPGDIGWVLQVHGEYYAVEYGLDAGFEGAVAQTIAGCGRMTPRERGWIAEVGALRVGSIFLLSGPDEDTALLRMFLLMPCARGLGLGSRLIDACLAFAREQGYKRIKLLTHNDLTVARGIYSRRGFQCVEAKEEAIFGTVVTSETWMLEL